MVSAAKKSQALSESILVAKRLSKRSIDASKAPKSIPRKARIVAEGSPQELVNNIDLIETELKKLKSIEKKEYKIKY